MSARWGDMWQHVGGTCDSTPWKSLKEFEHRNVKDLLKSKRRLHFKVQVQRGLKNRSIKELSNSKCKGSLKIKKLKDHLKS